ncbi:MAG: alpha/beta hydrolase [Desulfobacteraceae bacterium]|nr:alpha/beta hydrolase [Desulfobacteraceae bacterium]MBC2755573.1 alpha/beta hydrolase [Desulfobacteraceae bacterium]
MAEQRVEFNSDNGIVLEGLLFEGSSGRGVVITHPHPLYGGDMANIVVETIQKACRKKGHTTLRFNFRGVGRSSGHYDDGNGEQADVMAAFNFLRKKGLQVIDLAGYSFGSWVIAQMIDKTPADSVIMVSPPAAMMQFESTTPIPNLKLVVTGSHDEFAPPDVVEQLFHTWNPDAAFTVINGADHFFFGYTDQLTSILLKYL